MVIPDSFRDSFRRAVAGLSLLVVAVVLTASPAVAAPEAAIVMDMRNGEVLYSRSADRRLHPASLTKMMTLYLTFQAVREGRLKLDQKVRVSKHAARQPRSKLYLKTGQQVTIRSLIRATAIKSANDAAMVLAETIGGSQRGFARMMTQTAKRLGMDNTAFKNPHGLTARGHYSTARDMALLARHLYYDFPEYYNVFGRRSSVAAGKKIWSTNRLLRTYPGATGLKTGYTRAAGYNLAASAERGGKNIVAVQFGANSSGDRAKKVSRLLDIGFQKAKGNVRTVRPSKSGAVYASAGGSARHARVTVEDAPLPAERPTMQDSVAAALSEVLVGSAAAATPDRRRLAAITRKTDYIAPSAGQPVVEGVAVPVPRGTRTARGLRMLAPAHPALARVPIPPPKPVQLAQR